MVLSIHAAGLQFATVRVRFRFGFQSVLRGIALRVVLKHSCVEDFNISAFPEGSSAHSESLNGSSSENSRVGGKYCLLPNCAVRNLSAGKQMWKFSYRRLPRWRRRWTSSDGVLMWDLVDPADAAKKMTSGRLSRTLNSVWVCFCLPSAVPGRVIKFCGYFLWGAGGWRQDVCDLIWALSNGRWGACSERKILQRSDVSVAVLRRSTTINNKNNSSSWTDENFAKMRQ